MRCAQLSSRQNDCGKIVLAFFAAAAVESGASRTRAHLIDRYAIPGLWMMMLWKPPSGNRTVTPFRSSGRHEEKWVCMIESRSIQKASVGGVVSVDSYSSDVSAAEGCKRRAHVLRTAGCGTLQPVRIEVHRGCMVSSPGWGECRESSAGRRPTAVQRV